MAAPEMIVVGGANGSGKTTFASRYHLVLGVPFLNADNIAKELSERGVANAMIAAGRVFFTQLDDLLASGKPFVVETTLSGTYINKVAVRAQRMGFRVVTVFIFLNSPQTCVQRVASRISKGGHSVPYDDIVRRYSRANNNFRTHFIILSDEWHLYYNADRGFQQVATGDGDATTILHPDLYQTFQDL